jgi:hypothetical protein
MPATTPKTVAEIVADARRGIETLTTEQVAAEVVAATCEHN